jgi:hypothetical protein
MRTLVLYRFRYRDAPRGQWITARYVCQAPEIRCRYSDYALVGAPDVRHVPDDLLASSAAHLARSPLGGH